MPQNRGALSERASQPEGFFWGGQIDEGCNHTGHSTPPPYSHRTPHTLFSTPPPYSLGFFAICRGGIGFKGPPFALASKGAPKGKPNFSGGPWLEITAKGLV